MKMICGVSTLRYVAALALMSATREVWAAGDVFDQFFRYTEKEHKALFSEMPGETVDPFTGTLRIVQTDLVLPGKAGLDLRIVRSYNSKIWGRSDLLDMEPLLAEKEHSVLGYGWTFHMGRLKNPNASGSSGTCSGDFPILEEPDGTARVFYPTATAGVFVSKDFWRLQQSCSEISGAGACIWSNTGTRHEFRSANQYWYGASLTPVWPTSAIVDTTYPNNRIIMTYLSQTGAVSTITDTYNREISFSYTTLDNVTKRLDTMTANGRLFSYQYTLRQSGCTTGCYSLPGSGRYFLTKVQPPIGPPYLYEYAYAKPVAQNQYALSKITYPAGGTTTYTYGSVSFFAGYENVPFAVVTQRIVAGRGVTSGTWTYAYSAPGQGTAKNVTTITRPDSKKDTYTMYGLGYVAGLNPTNPTGNTWSIGLTTEIARANRAEVETFTWGKLASTVSGAYFSAPVYSNCGVYPIYDVGVNVPVMTQRKVTREGATYTTNYSNFDAYGQPRTVGETGSQSVGTQSRTTAWTYSPVTSTSINWVRGRPATQHVTVGSDSVDNSWTYRGAPDYARDSETLAGVTTTFGYDTDGNLSRVTNELGQDLTLSGYVNGTPTSLNFNGAFTITRTATWEGWVQTQRNGRGYTTTYDFDAIGRIKTVTPPGTSYATNYTYATDGSNVVLTRGSYSKTTNHDGLGRSTSTSDSEGVLTSTRYDSMGRAWFKSYPYDTSIGEVGDGFVFDGLDRVTTRTKAYRPSTGTCDVSGACNVTSSYSNNCVTTTVYRASADTATTTECSVSFGDPAEKLLRKVTDANGKIWQYAYNGHNDLKTLTAPIAKGNRTYSYYSTTYFLQTDVTGESGTTTYGRNAIGQMASRRDARGVNVTYGYNDPLSRLRTITYGTGSSDSVTRSYDDESNLTDIASTNGGTFSYGYDEINRMTSQTWTFAGRTYTTTFHYNSAGCLDSMTYPTGTTVTMTCDTVNRVRTVSLGGSTIANSVAYHSSGQAKAMTFVPSGKSTSIVYDDRGRAQSVTSAGALGLTYGYDGADNVTSFSNSVVANSNRTMTYDKLDRIITSIAPYQWGTTAYDYDELGNRTLKSEAVTTNYTYDSSNRLASAVGSESYTSLTLTWDAAGRLASTSDGATYLYDGRGRRVQKADASGTTLYHYGADGRIIAETLPDGTKLRDYIYLGDKLLAVDGCITTSPPACSEREWYHTETLGTPLARTNATGTVTARFDYRAWGEPWSTVGPPDDRQYNGRVYDSGTGFHDYGARMYWPRIGRFISPDTVMGSPASPMTLNRYSYVLNNPYKYVDPTGQWPTETHNRIVDRAFPGLSPQQRQVLKDASRHVDRLANQTQAGNHDHAMRSPGEDAAAARRAVDARIRDSEAAARRRQGNAPAGVADISPAALSKFGEGMHTVMDRTSPAHTDANGDPRVGSGIPTTPSEARAMRQHVDEEANITPDQMDAAVNACRESFGRTFGGAAEREAAK